MDLGGRYKHVAEYFSVPVIIIQIQYVLLSCQMIQACTTKINGVETQKKIQLASMGTMTLGHVVHPILIS